MLNVVQYIHLSKSYLIYIFAEFKKAYKFFFEELYDYSLKKSS